VVAVTMAAVGGARTLRVARADGRYLIRADEQDMKAERGALLNQKIEKIPNMPSDFILIPCVPLSGIMTYGASGIQGMSIFSSGIQGIGPRKYSRGQRLCLGNVMEGIEGQKLLLFNFSSKEFWSLNLQSSSLFLVLNEF
jgi:hypothetical protein